MAQGPGPPRRNEGGGRASQRRHLRRRGLGVRERRQVEEGIGIAGSDERTRHPHHRGRLQRCHLRPRQGRQACQGGGTNQVALFRLGRRRSGRRRRGSVPPSPGPPPHHEGRGDRPGRLHVHGRHERLRLRGSLEGEPGSHGGDEGTGGVRSERDRVHGGDRRVRTLRTMGARPLPLRRHEGRRPPTRPRRLQRPDDGAEIGRSGRQGL
mmetsp:Transcript_14667/g.30113  ORF Transcript_14667/g.30113 Transcript_14667/m.30113 type:complete len:209 (+) Transcript_14667:493-1119(+)